MPEALQAQIDAGKAAATAEAADTLLALDRKRCTEHLAAAGVPVPEMNGPVVRQRYAEPGDAASYMGQGISTSLELVRTRSGFELRHTLNRRSYGGPYQKGQARNEAPVFLDLLARDSETFAVGQLPTAFLRGAQHRFRFAVVDGRVTHAVGRLAETLLAREYYGGRRREIDAYHERFGAEAWQRLVAVAEHASAAFPGLRAVGVDIAADQSGGPDLVYEIDPFGARLPAALGMAGTAGEGLEVAATMLRSRLSR